MNRDCLCRAAAVAAVVSCSERTSDRVLTSASAWGRLARHFNAHRAAVVRRSCVVHHKLVRTLSRVIRWDAQFWSSRVLNGDCLCRAAAVAAVVSRSERASDRVLTSASAWSRLARHFNAHRTAVVCRRSVVHHKLVRALGRVVGRNARELRSCRVLNRDRLSR